MSVRSKTQNFLKQLQIHFRMKSADITTERFYFTSNLYIKLQRFLHYFSWIAVPVKQS